MRFACTLTVPPAPPPPSWNEVGEGEAACSPPSTLIEPLTSSRSVSSTCMATTPPPLPPRMPPPPLPGSRYSCNNPDSLARPYAAPPAHPRMPLMVPLAPPEPMWPPPLPAPLGYWQPAPSPWPRGKPRAEVITAPRTVMLVLQTPIVLAATICRIVVQKRSTIRPG
eukprot:7376847-Prymnesium_polylepis.1